MPTSRPSPRLPTSSNRQAAPPTTLLSHAITSKLEDGNLRAAIRLLCSDDTLAAPCEENLIKLQEKHPQASSTHASFPDPSVSTPLLVDESDVQKAVLSFPVGSSGGPDGMRPQHFKDLIQCRKSGSDFLMSLTGFVNLLLRI